MYGSWQQEATRKRRSSTKRGRKWEGESSWKKAKEKFALKINDGMVQEKGRGRAGGNEVHGEEVDGRKE